VASWLTIGLTAAHKHFYDIKQVELLDVAKGRGIIDFDGYLNVVQRVAANYENCHPFIKRHEVQCVNI
jgi:hypothetical protein